MLSVVWQYSRAIWTNRRWRGLIFAGTVALSLSLLVLALFRSWPELVRYQWQFDWPELIFSALAYACSLALALMAWVVIMRALDASSSWQQDAKFCLYSLLARRLPTPLPYITSRILLYEEVGVPKRITSVGILWENLLTLTSGAILILLLLPFTTLINDRANLLPVLLVAGLGVLLMIRPMAPARLVNRLLQRLGKAPLEIFIRPSAMVLTLLLYVGGWLLGGLILFFLIRAIYSLAWETMPLVIQGWVLSSLASYIAFFAPIGFGIRDLTLGALLLAVLPLPMAVVIVLLVRLWIMGNELLWALIFYRF